MNAELRFVYVTASSEDEAMALGRRAVEARLAACANVLPGMRSVYWWEGKIDEGREAVLILKTRADLVETLTRRIKEWHSYTVPCVLSWAVAPGNQAYADWLMTETKA